MNLTIELSDELIFALEAQAEVEGVTASLYVGRVLENALVSDIGKSGPERPLVTGRGMFTRYGNAPSEEELDANRMDMFRGFAQDH